jgi:hypothetical protein
MDKKTRHSSASFAYAATTRLAWLAVLSANGSTSPISPGSDFVGMGQLYATPLFGRSRPGAAGSGRPPDPSCREQEPGPKPTDTHLFMQSTGFVNKYRILLYCAPSAGIVAGANQIADLNQKICIRRISADVRGLSWRTFAAAPVPGGR